ncbi:hypothetical protein Maes01_00705 [Microbulbifer aestuariivivens]|uniref:Uncharacterized protein n=1 Tax=Microbulbifer aestuariivivens TaxID=1908308 RepID=A0ABP9WP02_9GAMM
MGRRKWVCGVRGDTSREWLGKKSPARRRGAQTAVYRSFLGLFPLLVHCFPAGYLTGLKAIFSFFLPHLRAFLMSFSIHTSMRFLKRLFMRSRTV